MNYTCATQEAADHAADRQAAFSAPSPARTNLTAIHEAAGQKVSFSAPSPTSTSLTAIQEAADHAAAFAVRFIPPA